MRNNDVLTKILREEAPLGQEYTEIVLDSLLKNETLKSIPVVNTFVGVYKLSRTISDAIFLKKLMGFIYNLQDLDSDEIEIFIEKYTKDDKKFTEKLICALNNMDDTDKCKYLANIFKCYGRGQIDYLQFKRYVRAINLLSIDEIDYLKDHINDEKMDTLFGVSLLNAGLAKIDVYFGGTSYSFSEEGINFFKCILEY